MNSEFLQEFKRKTEERWRLNLIDPAVYGFKLQRGTCWNTGLSEEQILAYENEVSICFPLGLKAFLRVMNGTNVPTLNVLEVLGEPPREWIGVYELPQRRRTCSTPHF